MISKEKGRQSSQNPSGSWQAPGSAASAPAPLVAIAHGSRDPAAQLVIAEIAEQVRLAAPELPVTASFLQHAEPSLNASLTAAGPGAVVVPLLLAPGYHLEADVAVAARSAGAVVADPLGPDPLLTEALLARLAEAGVPAETPIVLAAAGSADPRAAAATECQAALLADETGVPVLPGYASAASPSVREAVAGLAGRASGLVAVAAYLLAPGHFHDQLRRSGATWVTAPLGARDAVAKLVLARYFKAVGSRGRVQALPPRVGPVHDFHNQPDAGKGSMLLRPEDQLK
ncbi:MAG TPA: CbiX/SirB N-terminal domain-containing protein [Streptosporangiaceae bacterium]|jgi:sirohydrochlorin ferrochelatase